jgi:hypothetical protein
MVYGHKGLTAVRYVSFGWSLLLYRLLVKDLIFLVEAPSYTENFCDISEAFVFLNKFKGF